MYDPYKALYIHIPFCKSRCGYCDFATEAIDCNSSAIDDYVDDLILQIRRASKEEKLGSIETVYIGGGTPTHIGIARLTKLLYALSVSMHLTPEAECTIEANPDSLTEQMVKDIWALGVNRLSIGVQSLNDEVLQTLGRAHTSEEALAAIAIAQTRFDNVSVDIMGAIPGQSIDSLRGDLDTVVRAGVKHVSMYPLTIEESTPFEALAQSGIFKEPEEDAQALMMEAAQEVLEPAGFARYEVASYALPGYASKHNQAYWTGKPYIGFGHSAVTMTQNADRRMRVQNGQVVEDLGPAQMLAEDLMMQMRMSKGVSCDQVTQAAELLPKASEAFNELVDLDLVVLKEGRYRPTHTGWLCGNELYGRIYDLA